MIGDYFILSYSILRSGIIYKYLYMFLTSGFSLDKWGIDCSSRWCGSDSQNSCNSQPSVTAVLRNAMFSSSLHRYCTWCTDIHAHKTPIHMMENWEKRTYLINCLRKRIITYKVLNTSYLCVCVTSSLIILACPFLFLFFE